MATADSRGSERSGRYIQQPTGYRAFIPTALPPVPPLRIAEIQTSLSKADIAIGRLDGSIHTLPNADHFVLMYLRKEAVLSSQIEGTQSSLHDVLNAEAKILDAKGPSDVGEIINYIAAMRLGFELLAEVPVSVRLIRSIHARLLEGVRGAHLKPGEFRTSQNWIGAPSAVLNEAAFVPPPPAEVAQALSDLEKFIHAPSDLPTLVKIGLIHAQFETIHPFLDGNGRVGRLLISFLLCQSQELRQPVLHLSNYFKRHRNEYYAALQAVRDQGAWEEWLRFFLDGVSEVSREASDTAREILLLRERHRMAIIEKFGRAAANGHRLLEYLYTNPQVSINQVQELIGTAYPAANSLVERFVEAGILGEITGNARNRLYRYYDYVALFMSP